MTNRLYFHSAPWHCLTAVNIDVICEGPGHTKADPRRLDRSMGHHVRRLVLLQHKHRSCLRVSPPSLSQLRAGDILQNRETPASCLPIQSPIIRRAEPGILALGSLDTRAFVL